jgi:hypothetical protein
MAPDQKIVILTKAIERIANYAPHELEHRDAVEHLQLIAKEAMTAIGEWNQFKAYNCRTGLWFNRGDGFVLQSQECATIMDKNVASSVKYIFENTILVPV